MTRPAERMAAFYDQRGMAEQWIKEGKFRQILNAIAVLRPLGPARC